MSNKCYDASMEIIAGATIFCGEATIEVTQYGCCFTDEHDRDLMGASESHACERFQAAITAACGRAERAAQYEMGEPVDGMDAEFIEMALQFFFGGGHNES